MTREEFEVKYAMKYWGGDFTHNPTETLQSMESNRRSNGYADHHIDLCWKVQQIKDEDMEDEQSVMLAYLEW